MAINVRAGESMVYKQIKVYTDGGARGNPGPAAIGVYMRDDHDSEIKRFSKYIGEATNNVAEYSALLGALEFLDGLEFEAVKFFLDSELVVRQVNGEYKVKDPKLKELYLMVRQKLSDLGREYSVEHIRREGNKVADGLVNYELDKQSAS